MSECQRSSETQLPTTEHPGSFTAWGQLLSEETDGTPVGPFRRHALDCRNGAGVLLAKSNSRQECVLVWR